MKLKMFAINFVPTQSTPYLFNYGEFHSFIFLFFFAPQTTGNSYSAHFFTNI